MWVKKECILYEFKYLWRGNCECSNNTQHPLSKQKIKSLGNINYVNDNLNTFSFKKDGIEYTGITIPIVSKDYTFIYTRFSDCFGDTETLIKDFFKESVENNIEAMKDLSNFREEIALPKTTMKK